MMEIHFTQLSVALELIPLVLAYRILHVLMAIGLRVLDFALRLLQPSTAVLIVHKESGDVEHLDQHPLIVTLVLPVTLVMVYVL